MTHGRELAARFEAYSDWRRRLSAGISGLHEWLSQQELADAQADLSIQHLLERLHQDQLVVAFVAEFSRGKSELINAIFFADFGQRLLPSAAGRTTMCPTELLYDSTRPPSIRLLPIETRARDGSVTEFKNYADEWVTLALDLSSADRMSEVLSQVSQTKRVPIVLARKYGLYDDGDVLAPMSATDEAAVDIPCWRHAVINFPHPLLQQGLVILDTPGLNAIGTEPELTLNLLPNAHAVLFLLAADAAVSAQKALVAKVNGDNALLTRSRLPALEHALSGKLIPAKREIIGAATQADARGLAAGVRSILDARMAGVAEQLDELTALRGKNLDVIVHMMDRIREEKDVFERGLARYTALRNVFTQQTNEHFDIIGLPALRANAANTRERIEGSLLTKGVREAMNDFFAQIKSDLDKAAAQSVEIHDMMRAMYVRFANDHGLAAFLTPPFSVLKYQKEIE